MSRGLDADRQADPDRAEQFEAIGLQQGLFTAAQLEDVRREAASAGADPGALLVARGWLSEAQRQGLERAVTYRLGRDADKAIAKIMVDSGYCGEQAVEEALARQKTLYQQTGELVRLGTLLLEGRAVTDSQLLAARKIREIERHRDA